MKTTQHGIHAMAAILLILVLIGLALSSHGQSAAQSTADTILQPVAPENVPENGTFFLLSGYLANGGSLPAPYPSDPVTNAPVYALNGNATAFMVDDTAMTNDAEATNALTLLLQPQDAYSSNMLYGTIGNSTTITTGRTMTAMDFSGSDFGDDEGYSPLFGGPYSFDTNSLWLEITNVFDGFAYLNLYNATDQVYAIWSTTNLPDGWNVESELWPTNPSVMPFTELTLDRQNLFFLAEDWTGVTENGNTVPDWWFWKYFAATSLYDTNLDSVGNTLLSDFQNGVDPNCQFAGKTSQGVAGENQPPLR